MNCSKRGFTLFRVMSTGLLLLGLVSCGDTGDALSEAPLRQVRSIVLSSGSGFIEASYSGTLRAAQEASLSFKISGTVRNIAVKVGDSVVRGEIIASLDPSIYELESQRQQASLSQAEAALRNATSNYERVRRLYENGNQSLSALDDARSNYDSATATVETAKRALEIANLDLSYTQLQAEADCAIASVDAEQGENVSQGTQIFYANCGTQLEVSLNIPESVIASIKKDMPVDVSFSAIPDETFSGRVNEVGISAVQGGSTFPVTVTLDEPYSGELIAGLSADVVFSLANNSRAGGAALTVPSFAVSENESGPYVYVLDLIDEDRATVNMQPVVVGSVRGDSIEIASGLVPGMYVVTAGVSVLRDGMEVKYSGGVENDI